jgi:hypothetical protein
MINDLDKTIKQLLLKKGEFESLKVEITFEAPDHEWAATLSKPTINVYLYDIRENHRLRATEWSVENDGNGMATRRKNPNRIDLTYLVTAWANAKEDEHRLLWSVLSVLFAYPVLPEDILQGKLAGQPYPINAITAQPDGMLKDPAEYWGALDNKLKPSISYTVTVPLDLEVALTSPVVTTKTIAVKGPGIYEEMVQVAGVVHAAGKADQPYKQTTVVAREVRRTARTDEYGRYIFSRMPPGKHTIQVVLPGRKVWETTLIVPGKSYDLEVEITGDGQKGGP